MLTYEELQAENVRLINTVKNQNDKEINYQAAIKNVVEICRLWEPHHARPEQLRHISEAKELLDDKAHKTQMTLYREVLAENARLRAALEKVEKYLDIYERDYHYGKCDDPDCNDYNDCHACQVFDIFQTVQEALKGGY